MKLFCKIVHKKRTRLRRVDFVAGIICELLECSVLESGFLCVNCGHTKSSEYGHGLTNTTS